MHDPPHKNKPEGRSKNEVDQCGKWTPLNELPQTGGEEAANCCNDISRRTLPIHFLSPCCSPHRIHTHPLALITVVNMLEHGLTLLLVAFRCVGTRQFIKDLFDRRVNIRTSLLALTPIQNELRFLQSLQQRPIHFPDLFLLGISRCS